MCGGRYKSMVKLVGVILQLSDLIRIPPGPISDLIRIPKMTHFGRLKTSNQQRSVPLLRTLCLEDAECPMVSLAAVVFQHSDLIRIPPRPLSDLIRIPQMTHFGHLNTLAQTKISFFA